MTVYCLRTCRTLESVTNAQATLQPAFFVALCLVWCSCQATWTYAMVVQPAKARSPQVCDLLTADLLEQPSLLQKTRGLQDPLSPLGY